MQNFTLGGDARLFLQADIHGQKQRNAQGVQQGPVAHHLFYFALGNFTVKVGSDGCVFNTGQLPAGDIFSLHSPIIRTASEHDLHIGAGFHDVVNFFNDHIVNRSMPLPFACFLSIFCRLNHQFRPAHFIQSIQKQQILGRFILFSQQGFDRCYCCLRIRNERFFRFLHFCLRHLFHRPVLTDLPVYGAVNKSGCAIGVQPSGCIRGFGKLHKQRDLRCFGVLCVLICLFHDVDQAGGFTDAAFTHQIDVVFRFCQRIK